MASPQAYTVIGKDVIGSDSQIVGHVLGVLNNAEGEAFQIGIEFIDGEFSTYLVSQIIVVDDKVFIKYDWDSDFETLIRDFKSISKKISALDKLYQNNEIPNDVYTDIRRGYESTLAEVLGKQKNLVNALNDRLKALNNEVYSLRAFVAQTKVEYLTGNIDEQTYKVSDSALQAKLNKVLPEKGKLATIANGILAAFKEPKSAFEPLASPSESKPAIPLKLRDAGAQLKEA